MAEDVNHDDKSTGLISNSQVYQTGQLMERIIKLNAVETASQRSSYRMKVDYLHPYYDPTPEKISIYHSALSITRATVPETSTCDRYIKCQEWSQESQFSGFSLQE